MPINPQLRALYPANWNELSEWVKHTRAAGQCEFFDQLGHRCEARHGEPHPITGSIVVLTTAHLDHDPSNNDPGNLRAGCQFCHLRYDHDHHVRSARLNRREARNTPDLFENLP